MATHDQDTLVNPYDLLGVNIDSDVKQVRKAYKRIALHVHEDKGGNKDDMIILNDAYNFVLREITHADHDRKNATPQQVLAEFQKFCEEQTEQGIPAEFQEGWDLDKFNEIFDAVATADPSSVMRASVPGGYGDVMDSTEVDADTSIPTTHTFERDIVNYTAPTESIAPSFPMSYDLELSENGTVEYNAVTTKGMRMYDYKESFSPPSVPVVPHDDTLAINLADAQASRTADDNNRKPSNNLVWSFTGLLDKTGHRVYEYLKLLF
jgi:curved DNA-binding protein CbpA